MLMAMIDTSIVLIALPDIFKGIHINPLEPGNTFYLLWMILGFMIVTAVLVVSLGRLGDMLGRVRMYNMGFVIYTFFSLLLSVTWMSGTAAGIWLVVMRLFQGVGAAFLIANSTAILTDAFPEDQRGMAVGINQIAAIAGSFIGLILGGLLGPIEWRLVFIISVPIGVFGSIWSYMKLKEVPIKRDTHVDWSGNLTFALGPRRLDGGHHLRHPALWRTRHGVVQSLRADLSPRRGHHALLLCPHRDPLARSHVSPQPLSHSCIQLRQHRDALVGHWSRRAHVHHGHLATGDLASSSRLQLLRYPAVGGHRVVALDRQASSCQGRSVVISPTSTAPGLFTVGGMTGATISFLLLQFLPANFSYPIYGALLFLNGISFGMFAAPNRAAIMNSLPKEHRGVGSGMASTFQNSGQVLSIGIFFSLMIIGLSRTLPHALYVGLTAQGVSSSVAHHVSSLPPVSTLFASFLGYNPMQHLLGAHVISTLSPNARATILGRKFFPRMIEKAFVSGLRPALDFAAILCGAAAVVSWMRGSHVKTSNELSALEVDALGAPANAD